MKINTFIYFYPEKPVLITTTQGLFKRINADPAWIAEKKYNGIRLQLHYNRVFEFWNRHGEKIKRFTPDDRLQEELFFLSENLKGYWLFDGELRDSKVKGIRQMIIIYDIFIAEGEVLLRTPFSKRRKLLEEMFTVEGEPLGITKQYREDFEKLFEAQTDEEIEGLVLKSNHGLLNLGRKSGADSNWMYKVRKPTKKYKF